MFKKELTFPIAVSALIASLGYVTPASAQNAPSPYASKAVVYVETNNPAAGQNAILAFHRGNGGKLSELEGSPFSMRGTGVLDPSFGLTVFSNDTPVIANRRRTLLFAVNEGSNTIAVFRIGDRGVLTDVPGSPFPSGGLQPASLSLVDDILTVVNKNGDPAQAPAEAHAQPNYTTFRVEPGGELSANPGSTVASTASPSQALGILQSRYRDLGAFGYDRERNGDDLGFVFGADFGGGRLQSFELGSNGTLRQNMPLPLPAQLFAGKTFLGGPAPALPLGLEVHPRYPILYVGFVTINEIGVYVFGPEGKLYFVTAVNNPAPTNCWILINKTATRMYVVDTLTNQITTFDISTDPLYPQSMGVTQLNGSGRGFELALSDDDRFLYVISQQATPSGSARDNALHVLRVNDEGAPLTEIQTDLLPTFVADTPSGTRWEGVVAF